VLAVAGLIAWWGRGRPAPQSPSAPPGRHAETPPAAASEAVRVQAVPAGPSLPVPAPAVPASSVELCGLGRVAVDEDNPDALSLPLQRQALRTSRAQAARHPDPAVRALLAFTALEDDPAEADRRRDELARSAVDSIDPALYSMAMRACRPDAQGRVRGACQLLSLQRWAALDADNGAVWLEVAGDAVNRGQRAEVEQALYRASIASRWDVRWGLLRALVDRALPTSVPGWQRAVLTIALHGAQQELSEQLPGLDCAHVRAISEWARHTRHIGEVGVLRRHIAASGRGTADWAAAARAAQAAIAAAAASSAASAAP
jgi:hypothetical protein